MKRRSLIGYMGAGALATGGTFLTSGMESYQAQTSSGGSGGLTIQWFGHSCFLYSGGGQRILVNPFKPGGCTAKYPPIQVGSDLVMISSQLLDEGFVDKLPGDPKLLFESGIYRVGNLQIQGISTDHDRNGGRRFGKNMVWKWSQGGVKVLHLGGIASPISLEQQILMGQPDVLMIPVGGGLKVYNPEEAVKAIQTLKPKVIIPTQYQTSAADPATCSLASLSDFVKLLSNIPTQKIGGSSLSLSSGSLPKSSTLYVLGNPV
jgi:L-ascorbate metabolism protein UlaG (beta-lactamase superfamily)